jgi:type II secretory pathway component PulF
MLKLLKQMLHNLNLSDFRGKRDEFYDQLARSHDNREGLRFFLDAELKIAVARRTRDSSRAYALRLMRTTLARGDNPSYANILSAVMPADDMLLLAALDDAKDKAGLLRVIAQTIRERAQMVKLVRSRVIPPLLILPGAFGFTYIMATQSIPIIMKVAPPGVWTPFNALVRDFALFVAGNTGLLLLGAAFGAALVMYLLPRWTGGLRTQIEGMSPGLATLLFPVMPFALPMIVYRDFQAGLMFNALSVMLQSGRTLKEALLGIRKRSRPWLRWHLTRVLRQLETNPTAYQQAFESGLMSPLMLARLSSQMRSNPKFDEVLVGLGQKGAVEVREVVDKQMSKLNTMLLVMGGAVVVFVWIGQLSISQSMQNELSPAKQMGRQSQSR